MNHYKAADGACPDHMTIVLRKKLEHFNKGQSYGGGSKRKGSGAPRFSPVDECQARDIDYVNFVLYMTQEKICYNRMNGLTVEQIMDGYEKIMQGRNLLSIPRFAESTGRSYDTVKLAMNLGFVEPVIFLAGKPLIDPTQAVKGMEKYRAYKLEQMAIEAKLKKEQYAKNKKKGFKKGAFRFATSPDSIN